MKRSRGFIPKCPNWAPTGAWTSGGPGAEHCVISKSGKRFEAVRYRKTGNIVLWLVPSKGPIGGRPKLPMSHPTTRSLTHAVSDSLAFLRRIDKPRA